MASASAVFALLLLHLASGSEPDYVLDLLMPDSFNISRDTHFCTAVHWNKSQPAYITGIEPIARIGSEYHMLLYGCQEPGFYDPLRPTVVWNCDPDPDTLPADEFPFRTTCAPHKLSTELFQVTLNTPPPSLPPNAGFKIGGKTGIAFLVLRIHQEGLEKIFKKSNKTSLQTSRAGFRLTISPPSPGIRRVSLLALGAHGIIPPRAVSHLESAFKFTQPGLEMHPIAFQVHTHRLGTAVTGWKVSSQGTWSLIGRYDPQKTEMFHPVADSSDAIIKTGDLMAMRCTMNNTLDRAVLARVPDPEEMCAFFLLYFVENDLIWDRSVFNTPGPPRYFWKFDRDMPLPVPNDVDLSASRAEE